MAKKTLAQRREAQLTKLVTEQAAISKERGKIEADRRKLIEPLTTRAETLQKKIGKFAERHGFSAHEVGQMIAGRVKLATQKPPAKVKPAPTPEEDRAQQPKTAMAGTEKPARA